MDILSQYNKEHPEASQEQKQAPLSDSYGRAYTGMTAWLMRVSGGRIRDARTASVVLLGIAGCIIAIALVFYALGSSGGISQPTQDLISRPQPQESLSQ